MHFLCVKFEDFLQGPTSKHGFGQLVERQWIRVGEKARWVLPMVVYRRIFFSPVNHCLGEILSFLRFPIMSHSVISCHVVRTMMVAYSLGVGGTASRIPCVCPSAESPLDVAENPVIGPPQRTAITSMGGAFCVASRELTAETRQGSSQNACHTCL